MTTALDELCNQVEVIRSSANARGITSLVLDACFVDDAVRDIRALQAELRSLRGVFAPTIAASGAVVKFASDGTVSIVADHVEITGTVHA